MTHTWVMIAAVLYFFSYLTGCNGKNDSSNVHIRKDFTVKYYLNKEANLQTEAAVKTAFQNWENATDFTFQYAGRNRSGIRRDGKNTISFLTVWPHAASPGKAAWCLNFYDRNGMIVESDIIFNMELSRFTTLKTNTPDSYYIEGLMAHEIGHMLGLEHIENPYSIMKPFSSAEESYFLGQIDEKTIMEYKKLYSDNPIAK